MLDSLLIEVFGAALAAVFFSLAVYGWNWRNRRAAKHERRKLSSLIALRFEDVLGVPILPEKYRRINIEFEPSREKDKLTERLTLVSSSISFDQYTFLFNFVKRLYQEKSAVLNMSKADVFRAYRVLSRPDVASLVWSAIEGVQRENE